MPEHTPGPPQGRSADPTSPSRARPTVSGPAASPPRRAVRRFGVVGTVVSALAVGGLAVASPAEAAVVSAGRVCHVSQGTERCLKTNFDLDRQRFRGYAVIRDLAGGANYRVAVNELYLQVRSPSGRVRTIRLSYNADHDGWHGTTDSGTTKLIHCSVLNRGEKVRTRAHFQWRKAGSATTHRTTHYSKWANPIPFRYC